MKLFRTPTIFRWLFPRRTWGFFRDPKKVYLTFDDGPTPELTSWILEELNKNKLKATFFCVGANAEKHPDLMKRTLDEGHAIGNHTMRHEKGTAVSKDVYLKSIAEAHKFVESNLFRPPYGRVPMTLTRTIRKEYRIIMWTWLSYDYDPNVSVQSILQNASRIKGGDILVVHDNEKVAERIKEILPKLISIVQAKGLEFEVIE